MKIYSLKYMTRWKPKMVYLVWRYCCNGGSVLIQTWNRTNKLTKSWFVVFNTNKMFSFLSLNNIFSDSIKERPSWDNPHFQWIGSSTLMDLGHLVVYSLLVSFVHRHRCIKKYTKMQTCLTFINLLLTVHMTPCICVPFCPRGIHIIISQPKTINNNLFGFLKSL